MITIEEAKQKLGEKYKDLPDEEIEKILKMMYLIGEIAVNDYFESVTKKDYNKNGTT